MEHLFKWRLVIYSAALVSYLPIIFTYFSVDLIVFVFWFVKSYLHIWDTTTHSSNHSNMVVISRETCQGHSVLHVVGSIDPSFLVIILIHHPGVHDHAHEDIRAGKGKTGPLDGRDGSSTQPGLFGQHWQWPERGNPHSAALPRTGMSHHPEGKEDKGTPGGEGHHIGQGLGASVSRDVTQQCSGGLCGRDWRAATQQLGVLQSQKVWFL